MTPFDGFGQIACIHYAPDADRMPGIDAELRRVGILPAENFRWHVTARWPAFDFAFVAARSCGARTEKTAAQWCCLTAHQQIVRAALLSGCRTLLVLEDDVRFLRDAGEARRIVASWDPAEFDICLFDAFPWKRGRAVAGRPFVAFDRGVMGASCYALNRAGMQAVCDACDEAMRGRTEILMSDVAIDRAKCRKAYTARFACVQKDFPRQMNGDVFGVTSGAAYRRLGIDTGDYNL